MENLHTITAISCCSVINWKSLFSGSIMNNFDEWSQIISTYLKSEADLLTTVAKHDIDSDAPREAFIREVLKLFLPSSYAIGSGYVVDSKGQTSRKLDLVIYRRDFPLLNLPGSSDRFLYESVLATIEVRPKLIRKTLFDALDSCASLSVLDPSISEATMANLAEKNHLSRNDKGVYVHEDPLVTARFNLVGRPPSFIYGFNGFKTSFKQLAENIEVWIEDRRAADLKTELKSFPAVIATQGCFGCRNAAPLSAKRNHLFGIGVDDAPIRLIVLNLLYVLNRRLRITADGYGLKPGLDAYLSQIKPPDIQYTTGKATNAEIRTGGVAEQVIDDLDDNESIDNLVEDEPVESTPEVAADSTAARSEAEPVEKITEDAFTEAVFESIPTANAVAANAIEESIEARPADTTREDKSSNPASELSVENSGIESEFIKTASEEDITGPLIDAGMVDAAANFEPREAVVEEEAPDPFAGMELVDPQAEADESNAEEEFADTLNMADTGAESEEVAESEEEFTATVNMSNFGQAVDSHIKTPTSEQDLNSTPGASNTQNISP
jgi:hypothetical protein